MRTIKDISEVVVSVKDSDLLDGKWLNVQLLSEKLRQKEEAEGLGYKRLRNKMYNSLGAGKYNTMHKIGLDFIDVDNPMKNTASLKLVFQRTVEGE